MVTRQPRGDESKRCRWRAPHRELHKLGWGVERERLSGETERSRCTTFHIILLIWILPVLIVRFTERGKL
jgi:hypothetical protein